MHDKADETEQRLADAERDGILMLITHLREQRAEADMGQAAALDELHRMIREGKHRRYVDISVMLDSE